MNSKKVVNECIKSNTDLLKLLFGLVFDGFFFQSKISAMWDFNGVCALS